MQTSITHGYKCIGTCLMLVGGGWRGRVPDARWGKGLDLVRLFLRFKFNSVVSKRANVMVLIWHSNHDPLRMNGNI